MADPGGLLPNPETLSDGDEFSEDEPWDSDTEEDTPEP